MLSEYKYYNLPLLSFFFDLQEMDEFTWEAKRMSWILKFLLLQKIILKKETVIPSEFTSAFIVRVSPLL